MIYSAEGLLIWTCEVIAWAAIAAGYGSLKA